MLIKGKMGKENYDKPRDGREGCGFPFKFRQTHVWIHYWSGLAIGVLHDGAMNNDDQSRGYTYSLRQCAISAGLPKSCLQNLRLSGDFFHIKPVPLENHSCKNPPFRSPVEEILSKTRSEGRSEPVENTGEHTCQMLP